MIEPKFKFLNIKIKRQTYEGKNAIVILIRDVSKKINQKLLNIKDREEKVERRQAENFSSTVSHEMRTPLGSILYFAE